MFSYVVPTNLSIIPIINFDVYGSLMSMALTNVALLPGKKHYFEQLVLTVIHINFDICFHN